MSEVKITELKPFIIKQPMQPRCQAKLTEEAAKWRKSGNSSTGHPYNVEPWDQCCSQSSYTINGRTLCRKHAAYYLLDLYCPPITEVKHENIK